MPLLDPLRTALPPDSKLLVLVVVLGLSVSMLGALVAFDNNYATPTAWARGQIVCGVITEAGAPLPHLGAGVLGERRVAALLYEDEGGDEGISLISRKARGFTLEVRDPAFVLLGLRRVVVEDWDRAFDILTGGDRSPLEQLDSGDTYEVHADVGDTVCLKREDSRTFRQRGAAHGEALVITDLAQLYHATPSELPALTRDAWSMVGAVLRRLGAPLGVLMVLLMIGIRLGALVERFGVVGAASQQRSITFALPLRVAVARLRHLGLFEALSNASHQRSRLVARLVVACGFDALAFVFGALALWPAWELFCTGALAPLPDLAGAWRCVAVLVGLSAVAVIVDTFQRAAGEVERRQARHGPAAQVLAELLAALSPAVPEGAELLMCSFEPRPVPEGNTSELAGEGVSVSVELPLEQGRSLTMDLLRLTEGQALLALKGVRPGATPFRWSALLRFDPGSKAAVASEGAATFAFAQAHRGDPAVERVVAAALQALRAGAMVSASAGAVGPSGEAVVMRQNFDAPLPAPERPGELRVAVGRKSDPVTPRVAAWAFGLEAASTRLVPLVAVACVVVGLVGLVAAPWELDLLDLESLGDADALVVDRLAPIVAALYVVGAGIGLLLRHAPWPAPPLVAKPAEASLVLGAEDRTLRLDEVTIHLDRPFALNLTRSGAPGERGVLGVEVLQQGAAGAAPVRLRLSAALWIDEASARLPELDSRADAIDARALVEQVWPALRAAAAAHGEPPRWTLHLKG